MKMNIDEHKISIYKSLFRGRNDIYAERWEKEGRTGYIPAYKVDWSEWENHKTRGGTFQDYKKKEPKPFEINAIESHITGEKTCGIYPLMEDVRYKKWVERYNRTKKATQEFEQTISVMP